MRPLNIVRKRKIANWSRQVSQVFSRNPRDGSLGTALWLSREAEEERLCELLSAQGVNVCIDGSTGTGKTSLARTELGFLELPYVEVQVTDGMNWRDFCRCLVTAQSKRPVSSQIKGGMKGILPHVEFSLSFGEAQSISSSLEEREKIASNWNEFDVCREIVAARAVLFIDDFEMASDELLSKVASMCKLFTQTFGGENAKILVVGTDAIFGKLMKKNRSLEARIEELTLGALAEPNQSWTFLQMGFEALNLIHPGNDNVEKNRVQLQECIGAVYLSCDGLLKSLMQLGEAVALKGISRGRVSPADIKDAAVAQGKRDFGKMEREVPRLDKLVRGRTEVRIVLERMYRIGINRVHYAQDLVYDLSAQLSAGAIEEALNLLMNEEFIVRTGESEQVIFTRNPRFAHLLGAVVSEPERFGRVRREYAAFGQLKLPFFVPLQLPVQSDDDED